MAEQSHRRQARRSFLKFSGLSLAVLLTGCQIIPGGGQRVEQAPPREPQRVERDPVPTADIRHKVAVLVPLTGPNAGVGTSISNAANLALLDTKANDVLLSVYDTGKGAAAAAQQAISDGNRLFLGPLLAEDAQAVAPLARAASIPVISFSNDISVAGNGVYIMGFNPGQSIERVVSHARAGGAQRFAGLIPEGNYGRRSFEALNRAVSQSGGRLVGFQTFDRTPASLRSAVIRLNGQSAYDAVLIADNPRIAVSAAATIRAGSSNGARILGTELWRGDSALTGAPTMRGAWFAAAPETMFDQLKVRYRARYGKTPYRLGSLGYDAVLLTVRIARDWRPGRPFPEAELHGEEGFSGVDGAFRFGRDNIADRQLEVVQVNAGGFTTVSPAATGFSR